MSENQHYTYADTLSSENPPGDSYEARMAVAQIEATLALAYEQRTANLIAFYGYGDIVELETITERLGL